jgi:hypothetical protein
MPRKSRRATGGPAVTGRRTRYNSARVVRSLVDAPYEDAGAVAPAMDDLNTHTPASLYEAFGPAGAGGRAGQGP